MYKILRNILFFLTILPISLYFMLLMNFRYYTRKNCESWGEKYGPPWHCLVLKLAGIKVEYDFSALEPNAHYVFMANHTSNLDISAFYWLLGREYPVRFVAKQSLWNIPLFGKCMAGAGHIPIDRSNRRAGMKSVAAAVEKTKTGICPIIFPEGTRSTDLSTLQPFKIGGMVLALKCDLPVAPMVIEGMGEVLPKGKILIDNTRTVRIKALAPIAPGSYTLKEREKFKDHLFEIMNAEYQKMRKEKQ